MLWRLSLAACLFAIGLGVVAGHAQFGPAVYVAAPAGGGGANNTALDGSAHSVSATSTTTYTSGALTTASTSDIIMMCLVINSAGGGAATVIAPSASPGITGWTQRATVTSSDPNNTIELWYGKAASTLAGVTITGSFGGSGNANYKAINVWGVSGADQTTIFDSGGPQTGATGTPSMTSANANDFVMGCYRFATQANPTQGTGYTIISGADNELSEYKKVTATGSQTAVIGTGNTDENGGIIDALKSN